MPFFIYRYHRTIYDPRSEECKKKVYNLAELPKASVIICFVDEAWSALMRSVCGILAKDGVVLLFMMLGLERYQPICPWTSAWSVACGWLEWCWLVCWLLATRNSDGSNDAILSIGSLWYNCLLYYQARGASRPCSKGGASAYCSSGADPISVRSHSSSAFRS